MNRSPLPLVPIVVLALAVPALGQSARDKAEARKHTVDLVQLAPWVRGYRSLLAELTPRGK